jgi:hypothetical protein
LGKYFGIIITLDTKMGEIYNFYRNPVFFYIRVCLLSFQKRHEKKRHKKQKRHERQKRHKRQKSGNRIEGTKFFK